MRHRPDLLAPLLTFAVGAGLLVAFEDTATRIAGVACLLGFIVLGVFAIATPEALGEDTDE